MLLLVSELFLFLSAGL